MTPISKQCKVCGVQKPASDFYGASRKCKPCYREIERERYRRNLTARRAAARARRMDNAEAERSQKRRDRIDRQEIHKARDRAKYQKHRGRIMAARVAYVAANKSKIRAASARQYLRTRDAQIAKSRAWRKENPGRASALAKSWALEHPEARRRHHQDRRARKRGAFVESVDVGALAKRDRDRCGLCHRRVAVEDRSVDHILPLSRGGEHGYKNTQLAHLACNIKKNATVIGQLRLL